MTLIHLLFSESFIIAGISMHCVSHIHIQITCHADKSKGGEEDKPSRHIVQ